MIPYKNRKHNPSKPVHVYRNLGPRYARWSIRQSGLVIGHSDEILLRDVDFVVSLAGQRRVRETGQKNVHAYVKGWLHWAAGPDDEPCPDSAGDWSVIYNPYEHDWFYVPEKNIYVLHADRAYFAKGVSYS